MENRSPTKNTHIAESQVRPSSQRMLHTCACLQSHLSWKFLTQACKKAAPSLKGLWKNPPSLLNVSKRKKKTPVLNTNTTCTQKQKVAFWLLLPLPPKFPARGLTARWQSKDPSLCQLFVSVVPWISQIPRYFPDSSSNNTDPLFQEMAEEDLNPLRMRDVHHTGIRFHVARKSDPTTFFEQPNLVTVLQVCSENHLQTG